MKVAITGATGFIGRHLAEEFSAAGHEVVCCGRSQRLIEEYTCANEASYFATDYSLESLRQVLRGCDQVFHLAGVRFAREADFASYVENVQLAWRVLTAAKYNQVQKIMLASSIAVYSRCNSLPWKEDEDCHPASLYGASKLAAEKLGELLVDEVNLDVISLRMAQVSGLHQSKGSVLDAYLERAKTALPPVVFGDGSGCKEYVYIKDLVTAIRRLAEFDAPSGAYNIGSGESISVRDLAEAVRAAFAIEAPIELRQDVPKINETNQMSIDKIKAFTGWCPQWPMKAALQDMCLKLMRKKSHVG